MDIVATVKPDRNPGNDLLDELYVPGLRAQLEGDAWMFGIPTRPARRRDRVLRPFRRVARRAGEVWNVARHGADYYREY
jgi:hypothetical protein